MRTIEHEGKVYERNLFLFLSEHYPTGINTLPETDQRVHADIADAFPWASTLEGLDYWLQVYLEWVEVRSNQNEKLDTRTKYKHKRLI